MPEFLKLKKSDCRNCYKCIRHCPVKSIRFSGNQAHIVYDECILCGQCYVICPQNAKETVDETEIVDVLLAGDAPVYASVAPSFIAYFEGASIRTLSDALAKLGFAATEETAVGATLVKRVYEKAIADKRSDVMITSCCHSVNLLIGKYYPDMMKYLLPVVSPMQAHCLDIKKRVPDAKTVFIGPCLSKKDEAASGAVDAVLTFRELAVMFKKAGITVENGSDEEQKSRARLFPVVGGIIKTMNIPENSGYTYLTVDGVENCKAALSDIAAGNVHNCFIEMNACAGGCIGGPVMEKYRNSPVRHYKAILEYAGKEDFDTADYDSSFLHKDRGYIGLTKVMPTEEEIRAILRSTGKVKPSDELNCGTCGYDTCREKAIAVFQGKADINMCLPYLMKKAESFSSNILSNTPNGIVVVNEDLEVQQINRAALAMFNIRSAADIMGEGVVRLVDPLPFLDVLDEHKQVRSRRGYYAEYNKYLELTIIHDKTSHILIAIFRDITDEEEERVKKENISRATVDIADKVVDKQMRIVQEIASLLGETAAETKIALTKLKESIAHEDE